MPNAETISTKVTPELKAELYERASRFGSTPASYLRSIVTAHLAQDAILERFYREWKETSRASVDGKLDPPLFREIVNEPPIDHEFEEVE